MRAFRGSGAETEKRSAAVSGSSWADLIEAKEAETEQLMKVTEERKRVQSESGSTSSQEIRYYLVLALVSLA